MRTFFLRHGFVDPGFKIIVATSADDIQTLGLASDFWLLNGTAQHCVIPLYIDKGVILCLSSTNRADADIAALVHECEHIKQFYLEMNDLPTLLKSWNASVPPIKQGEKEFHAYLIQDIFTLVLNAIKCNQV